MVKGVDYPEWMDSKIVVGLHDGSTTPYDRISQLISKSVDVATRYGFLLDHEIRDYESSIWNGIWNGFVVFDLYFRDRDFALKDRSMFNVPDSTLESYYGGYKKDLIDLVCDLKLCEESVVKFEGNKNRRLPLWFDESNGLYPYIMNERGSELIAPHVCLNLAKFNNYTGTGLIKDVVVFMNALRVEDILDEEDAGLALGVIGYADLMESMDCEIGSILCNSYNHSIFGEIKEECEIATRMLQERTNANNIASKYGFYNSTITCIFPSELEANIAGVSDGINVELSKLKKLDQRNVIRGIETIQKYIHQGIDGKICMSALEDDDDLIKIILECWSLGLTGITIVNDND